MKGKSKGMDTAKNGGKGAANKGAGKGKGPAPAQAGKVIKNAWTCDYAPCLTDLRRHAPTRGPYVNPASASHCKHCQTLKGFGSKLAAAGKAADKDASRTALRAAAAASEAGISNGSSTKTADREPGVVAREAAQQLTEAAKALTAGSTAFQKGWRERLWKP